MLRIPNVLLLSNSAAETLAMKDALGSAASLTPVRKLTELQRWVDMSPYDAVFCGWSFHQTDWKTALQTIRMSLGDVPVIFLSRSEHANEWKEVLEVGGFDLLLPPFSVSQTRAVLGQAVESYEALLSHNAKPLHEYRAG